jgi:PKD repeat protein
MKRVLLFGMFAILALSSLQFGQGLGNDKLLIHATGGVRWTQCAFGPDGVLWVVYEEDTDRGHPIWVVSYDGTNVSTPFNATGNLDIRGERPGISAGPKGEIVVTWGVLAEDTIYMRVRDPKTKTWLPVESVKIGYGADEPNSAVDGEGNIHVFWFSNSGFKAYARSKINGSWGESTKLGDGKDCGGAIAPDGTVWAIWRVKNSSGTYKNYYSTRSKTTNWTPSQIVTTSGGSSSRPWIAVGPNNVAVAVWCDIDLASQTGAEVRTIKIEPGAVREIVIPKETQHYPRVVVDKNNFIHVVSQRGGGDTGSGMRYTNNKSGSWLEPQAIDSSMNKLVGLAADPFGNVAACQSAFNSNGGSDVWVFSLSPIIPTVLVEASFTFSPEVGYPPLSVYFNALQQIGPNGQEVNYAWIFGDGGTASGRDVNHTYRTFGTFPVTLTVTDNTGRTDSIVKNVVVYKPNPLPPTELSSTIAMSRLWKSPEISYNLFWAANPAFLTEHLVGYAIYMKEGDGAYTRLLAVSGSTLSASFKFTDLKKKRSFAISTLGVGDTESAKVYFQ